MSHTERYKILEGEKFGELQEIRQNFIVQNFIVSKITKNRSYAGPLVKRGIPDVLFNSREEFYCCNNKLYKYKVLRCMVEQVKDG